MSDPARGQKLGKNHDISLSLQKPTFEALDETCSTIHSTTSTKKHERTSLHAFGSLYSQVSYV
jgi:hypothetical protein